ncbi:hypothetical protein TEA_011494 [Camellia sinensis var. sinensis]|uniref:F-box associated domain-containing protein n=1 Tax=Camellia sinensis var. sinensis TaxID=542762 RepID=A0A4S4CX79_CAMSN|nr:hypothetical protein TEA_011494 [Camellia sinensis var. sinensis]
MADASTAKRNPNPSSSETVANNDDLLNQILLYLPIRSLLRFKSVLGGIPNPNNPRPSGLFLYRDSHQIHPDFDFLSLLNYESPSKPPFNALTFVHDPSDLRILQSCNGLLLCRGLHLYIYNPTTSQFATLPQPPRRVLAPLRCYTTFYAYNLAFDPSKSPHYKVVSVNFYCGLPDHYELDIYSSETGIWSPSGDPFTGDVSFNLGVFWNGALHWISTSGGDSLYFNVDKERLETMPMPPIPDGWEERRLRYFRESRDHLHLIEIYGPHTTQFNVYKMERDYCGWFVKYRVDIDAIPNAFPEMIHSSLDPSDLYYYQFVILDLIREENDEESFLVLYIPGKVIRYNFRDKSFRELFDVPRCPDNECFSFEVGVEKKGKAHEARSSRLKERPSPQSLSCALRIAPRVDLFEAQGYASLRLMLSSQTHNLKRKYYVYNHTTKQFTTLPTLGFGSPRPVHGVNFAFNPAKSPHYKVMCVQSSDFSSEHYQIKIYSSNTGPWRVSGQPFIAHVNIQFNCGVYWNGAIHWLSIRGDPLCFVVDKKCLQIMSMPPLPSGYDRRWFNYFGESGDHLHLIERALEFLQLCYTFGCRRETTDGGESSFMVLHINGKVMRYSFEDKSLKKLCDFAASAPGRPVSFGGRRLCFPFIESLSCV